MLNIAIFLWYAMIYRALLTVIHHIFWTILILTKYIKTQVNILDIHQIISFSCPLQIYSIIYQWRNHFHFFSYAQSPKSFIEWHPEVKVLLSAYRKWNCPVLSCLMYATSLVVRRAGLLWSQQDFEWRWSVPLFKCLTVLEFSFILFDLCLLITFFNFIMNYVPIVTFWIFT